jgi:hypothetical protein
MFSATPSRARRKTRRKADTLALEEALEEAREDAWEETPANAAAGTTGLGRAVGSWPGASGVSGTLV